MRSARCGTATRSACSWRARSRRFQAYATVFSGFYAAFFLFLAMLISAGLDRLPQQAGAAWWRPLWDAGFTPWKRRRGLLIGVAMGNIAWGCR